MKNDLGEPFLPERLESGRGNLENAHAYRRPIRGSFKNEDIYVDLN
ncbi:MAG: hypothetical protein J0M24_15070 [Verrucomicrobia bacterium]|nr:hypothetical protein [Verrucomicrobiota bacterium]